MHVCQRQFALVGLLGKQCISNYNVGLYSFSCQLLYKRFIDTLLFSCFIIFIIIIFVFVFLCDDMVTETNEIHICLCVD